MRHFVINDFTRLEEFGFLRTENGWYHIKTNRRTNAYVNKDTGEITIQSASKEMIYIMCELYKSGVMSSFDDKVDGGYRMVLTKEERDSIIMSRLKEREGKKNGQKEKDV